VSQEIAGDGRRAYARGVRLAIASITAFVLAAATARADGPGDCYGELDARGVRYRRIRKTGIAQGVEITGPLGGVSHVGSDPLTIDCSLAVSLDEVGRYLRAFGVDTATYSSAYSRRTDRPSTASGSRSTSTACRAPSSAPSGSTVTTSRGSATR
jgi:hypothetical protein